MALVDEIRGFLVEILLPLDPFRVFQVLYELGAAPSLDEEAHFSVQRPAGVQKPLLEFTDLPIRVAAELGVGIQDLAGGRFADPDGAGAERFNGGIELTLKPGGSGPGRGDLRFLNDQLGVAPAAGLFETEGEGLHLYMCESFT